MPTLIFDLEVAPNAFGLGVKRIEDGRKMWYEFGHFPELDDLGGQPENTFDKDLIYRFMKRNTVVGFNSANFDMPLLYLALDGATNEELMDAASRIIQERIPSWQAERELGISIPKIDHIDLFETNPSVKNGLKALAGRMHVKLLQDLPFKPNTLLTRDEWLEGRDYCLNGDLEATHQLFERMREPIALREIMRQRYDTMDLRSKSDAQVGETILKTEVERAKGERIKKATIREGSTFRYDAPAWMKFQTPLMQEVFEVVKNTDFVIGKGGSVQFPREFDAFKIVFDGMRHQMGIGGLHSTEQNRAVHSDEDHVLIDADVASQYPSIIMKLGLYPKAMGEDFLPVYKSIIDARLAAKKAKDKATDKGLKIAINGSYGKLGSGYSTLFAPHLMVAVTLTGQLSLLMLIEAAHLAGIPVVSANTDGVVFRCPRSMFNGFDGDRLNASPIQDIIEWWEGVTSFKLEFAEYRSIFNLSVNTYMAITASGGFKRKGILANHWREELPWGGKNTDFDPNRSGLMKNPQMTICADAALGLILHGIPVEKTIRECQDVREFLTVVNATGGATWGRGAEIYQTYERTDSKGKLVRSKVLVGVEGEKYLGKVVRYYWSKDGAPILKVNGHHATGNRPKVPKTEGCCPLMVLPDDLAIPADLDYQRYIDEAYAILRDIGFYGEVETSERDEPEFDGRSPWERLIDALFN